MKGSLPERFWAQVNKNGPMPRPDAVAVHPEIAGLCCWIYGTAKRGWVRVEGRLLPAPHIAWYLATGKWPTLNILHRCDRPNCVRRSHLFEGTQEINMKDMRAKKRDRVVGERNYMAKLTAAQVTEIRRLGQPWVRNRYKHGTAALVRRLAKRFGLHVETVKHILKNEAWPEGK